MKIFNLQFFFNFATNGNKVKDLHLNPSKGLPDVMAFWVSATSFHAKYNIFSVIHNILLQNYFKISNFQLIKKFLTNLLKSQPTPSPPPYMIQPKKEKKNNMITQCYSNYSDQLIYSIGVFNLLPLQLLPLIIEHILYIWRQIQDLEPVSLN